MHLTVHPINEWESKKGKKTKEVEMKELKTDSNREEGREYWIIDYAGIQSFKINISYSLSLLNIVVKLEVSTTN